MLLGEVVKVGEVVDVYAMVRITPRSEKCRSEKTRLENTPGAVFPTIINLYYNNEIIMCNVNKSCWYQINYKSSILGQKKEKARTKKNAKITKFLNINRFFVILCRQDQ